jgi:hypothetical protein
LSSRQTRRPLRYRYRRPTALKKSEFGQPGKAPPLRGAPRRSLMQASRVSRGLGGNTKIPASAFPLTCPIFFLLSQETPVATVVEDRDSGWAAVYRTQEEFTGIKTEYGRCLTAARSLLLLTFFRFAAVTDRSEM